jgi:hypothetical protein
MTLPWELPTSPDRLICMVNQIGKFFQSQGHDKAAPGIAEHIGEVLESAHARRDIGAFRRRWCRTRLMFATPSRP